MRECSEECESAAKYIHYEFAGLTTLTTTVTNIISTSCERDIVNDMTIV